MGNRYLDWLRQADADLRHARNAAADGDFEWSCFAAQQAAEKALMALFQWVGVDAWGHTLTTLVGNLPPDVALPEALILSAKTLDKHYIPTRYPSAFDSGAPTDFYTAQDAENAIACAEVFVDFCRDQIGRP